MSFKDYVNESKAIQKRLNKTAEKLLSDIDKFEDVLEDWSMEFDKNYPHPFAEKAAKKFKMEDVKKFFQMVEEYTGR